MIDELRQRGIKKRTETSIKSNEIEGWSRDGRAKKYTNKICRDNHVHYTVVIDM